MQILYNEREALRFEYCLSNCTTEIAICRSLTDINKRLLKAWGDTDEADLVQRNSSYPGVLREIAELEGKTDTPALDQPFQMLTKNATYRDAREASARRIARLDQNLS